MRSTDARSALIGLSLLAVVVLTAGCATMTAEECMVADWERLGEADARAGRGDDFLGNRASDCADAGYPADTAAWYRGHERGLSWFCTVDNGYRFGLDGQRYQRTCPGHLESDFLDGYELGHAIHGLSAQVSSSRQELDRLNRELRQLEREENPDRSAISELRDDRNRVRNRLRQEEMDLARVRGVAEGRGFRVPQ